MKKYFFSIFIIATISAVVFGAEYMRKRHPVYVGARQCAKCHQGKSMGHQFSKWLNSRHAQAYAVLSKPNSKDIAVLSGVPEHPQESTMCLGCHATGAHSEDWERDETFFIEDGVQCENCHGPGSEYIDVMGDREQAIKAGLIIPIVEDCVKCHQRKDSHVTVHLLPALNMDHAIKSNAHPIPDKWKITRMPKRPEPADSSANQYVGTFACEKCHDGPGNGYQFSKWRMSRHANAYAVLGNAKAYEIAKQEGIKGIPQKSPLCLKCHTTAYTDPAGGSLDTYNLDEGVGCEACHGAGSAYSQQVIMGDSSAAKAAGLKEVTKQTCMECHENAHSKTFDYAKANEEISHPFTSEEVVEKTIYKTPLNMALTPNGRELYVACEASKSVIVVDARKLKKVAEITAGSHPTDVTFSPDGTKAYVSNRFDDTVSVINVLSRKNIATITVGDSPHGLLTDKTGKYLYVLNTTADSISVIDTSSLKEIKRLTAGHQPWSLIAPPKGDKIYVTNTLSDFVEFRTPSVSEITIIDTVGNVVHDRIKVPGTNLMQGIAFHPSGDFALFTLNRTKNLVPMTRLLQGWTITNGLGIVYKDGRVAQVLLDEPGQYFPDPTDVAITSNGRLALVTSSGSNRIAVVDLEKLTSMLDGATDYEREHVLPNHMGKPVEFVIAHIETKDSPRGILITPNGKYAFVANALDDSLTVIDVDKLQAIETIDLGGPKVITEVRYGERVFHSANSAFRRQFSCHSCHPDGHVNGLTFDIEPDGIGIAPVDNRTLRGILDTNPFKWEGTNPSLQRQCGPRLAVFFTRIQPFNPEELEALTIYICTIPRPPNRHRPLGGGLTEAQRRGKEVFERATTNGGKIIPQRDRCVNCHFPPLYTDRTRHDIGTQLEYDRESHFDTPHLMNVYASPPYLHNGIADTLEEIWTVYNPEDKHGVTNDLTKDQLNDLIEFLKTL